MDSIQIHRREMWCLVCGDMERNWRSEEGFIVTFIEFSKAFDSLVWEALWKIMECLGCTAKLVAVVEIVVLTIDHFNLSVYGWRFGSFICSKKGTRQGSGLSPCIFTMPVDLAMKVADLAGMRGIGNDGIRG